MDIKEILADLVKRNPAFFSEYEKLAQQFYNTFNFSITAIPEAHAKAMLTLLEESGYEIRKKPDLNIVGEKSNVISLSTRKS